MVPADAWLPQSQPEPFTWKPNSALSVNPLPAPLVLILLEPDESICFSAASVIISKLSDLSHREKWFLLPKVLGECPCTFPGCHERALICRWGDVRLLQAFASARSALLPLPLRNAKQSAQKKERKKRKACNMINRQKSKDFWGHWGQGRTGSDISIGYHHLPSPSPPCLLHHATYILWSGTNINRDIDLKDMQSVGKYASSCPGTSDGAGEGWCSTPLSAAGRMAER